MVVISVLVTKMATGGGSDREIYDEEVEAELEELLKGLSRVSKSERRSVVRDLRRSLERGEIPPAVQVPEAQSAPTGEDLADRVARTITIDNTTRKIKNFSGQKHLAPGEVDYLHWRRSAIQIACDPELTPNKKRVFVLQSLTGEAEDNVELVRDQSAIDIIKFLDSVYGRVADSHDLMASFFQLTQQPRQTGSEYASLLYRKLCDMVKGEVIREDELDKLLVNQFSRGLREENVVVGLRLDDLLEDPPSFADLMKRVRTYEARSAMRQAKAKEVRSHEVRAEVDINKESVDQHKVKGEDEVEELRERVSQLETVTLAAQQQKSQVGKFPSFCYFCGIEGHVAYDCTNAPNKELVKLKQRQRKQFYGCQKNQTSLRVGPKTRR